MAGAKNSASPFSINSPVVIPASFALVSLKLFIAPPTMSVKRPTPRVAIPVIADATKPETALKVAAAPPITASAPSLSPNFVKPIVLFERESILAISLVELASILS